MTVLSHGGRTSDGQSVSHDHIAPSDTAARQRDRRVGKHRSRCPPWAEICESLKNRPLVIKEELVDRKPHSRRLYGTTGREHQAFRRLQPLTLDTSCSLLGPCAGNHERARVHLSGPGVL